MTAYILNLFDLAFTLHALNHGAVELNPLMRCVPAMVFYKIIIVGALLRWISKRPERIARVGMKLLTVEYMVMNVWHVVNIAAVLAA